MHCVLAMFGVNTNVGKEVCVLVSKCCQNTRRGEIFDGDQRTVYNLNRSYYCLLSQKLPPSVRKNGQFTVKIT